MKYAIVGELKLTNFCHMPFTANDNNFMRTWKNVSVIRSFLSIINSIFLGASIHVFLAGLWQEEHPNPCHSVCGLIIKMVSLSIWMLINSRCAMSLRSFVNGILIQIPYYMLMEFNIGWEWNLVNVFPKCRPNITSIFKFHFSIDTKMMNEKCHQIV